MSEFINKAEIATLKQSNAELNNVISNLKSELYDLNCEIERLKKENPNDIKHLEQKVTEYENQEAELSKRILLISKEARNNNKKYAVVKQLLSALQVKDAVIVEAAIEQYYKKRGVPKNRIAFLLGTLFTLVVWLFSNYLENDEIYNTIIERLTKVVR
jgi:chromosome segregation ATPase